MKRCCAAALLVLTAFLAWEYNRRSAHQPPQPSTACTDPLSSAEAQRFFHCQPRHWSSMVLMFQ